MPRERERALRKGIVETARKMSATGLSPGKSGNVSARWGTGMMITASGVPYDEMDPQTDVIFVNGGQHDPSAKPPSTEWHFHKAIYDARPDVEAVVHCHSRYATALACVPKPIPAFHYMVAVAGGTAIPLAPYATFGTPDLAAHAAAALSQCNACLLANHGQIAVGPTLADALYLAEEVETLAAQYVAALAVGEPHILSDAQMAEVLEKFKTYGKPHQV